METMIAHNQLRNSPCRCSCPTALCAITWNKYAHANSPGLGPHSKTLDSNCQLGDLASKATQKHICENLGLNTGAWLSFLVRLSESPLRPKNKPCSALLLDLEHGFCWIVFSLRDCGLFGKRMLNRVKNMFMTKFSTTCGTTSIKFWEVCHCVDVLCWVWFILVVRACLFVELFFCQWSVLVWLAIGEGARPWGQSLQLFWSAKLIAFVKAGFQKHFYLQQFWGHCVCSIRKLGLFFHLPSVIMFCLFVLTARRVFPNDFDFECHFPFVFKQQALKSPNQCLNTKTSINISKISNGKTFVIWVPKPVLMPVHLPTCLFAWLFVCLFVCYIAHCFSVWDNALQTWYLQVNRKQNEMYKTTERHGERMPKFSEHMPPLKETSKNDAINHCHRCCCCLVMQTFCWGGVFGWLFCWGRLGEFAQGHVHLSFLLWPCRCGRPKEA